MATAVNASTVRSGKGAHIIERHPRLQRSIRNNGAPLMMCLPAILLLFVFAYLPMFGVIIAFKEYRFDAGILRGAASGLA